MRSPDPGPAAAPDPVDALRRPDAITRALLEKVSEGVCLVRATDGAILWADPKFCKMVGYPPKDLLGMRLDQLDGPSLNVHSLAPSILSGEASIDIPVRRKDGSRLLLAWRGAALQGQNNTWLLVAENVEARRRAEQLEKETIQRRQEIEELRRLDQAKTQFINTAAHELKTPLTPIKVQTHLLNTVLGAGLSDDQKQSVGILSRNLERLRHLVDDVLEAARVQANRLNVRHEALDLNPVVLETVESFKAVAAQVGVTIEWRYCEKPYVDGDRERLTQVVYNLLSNAVKFTPPGGRVTVETSKSDREAFLRVRDTGRGMTSEQIGRLFQPFGQVHDLMQDTRAGTGLGLYISAGIMAQHNGRIWAESAGPGRGSVFSFALPLTRKEVPARAGEPLSPEMLAMRPPKETKADPAFVRRLRELI